MVVFGKNGSIRAKVGVSWQSGYSEKNGCIREKVVAFGQKLLYSGKSVCIRAKVVEFGQGGCIRAKVVFFGQKSFYS